MKIEYKPIRKIVRVGHTRLYSPLFQGSPRYAWELKEENVSYNTQSFEDFSQSLRLLNVEPSQVDNIGTDKPFPTDTLPEDKLESLLEFLARLIVTITKLLPDKFYFPQRLNKKYNVLMDHPFMLRMGQISYVIDLREIPNELNKIGCTHKDILFHKQTPFGYTLLEDNYRAYILNSLGNE